MKIVSLLLLVLFSISGSAFAQNATNKASLRIGEITMPTNGVINNLDLSPQNLGYLRADFSITPLGLSPSDAKGLGFADSAGGAVFLALDNDAPIQFAVFNSSQINKQITLQTNTAYDFTLFIGPTSATAWWRTKTGIVKIGTLNHSLVPPFKLSIFTQRTGARFSDILVKEQ
jgi:hypothetical protein